MGGGGLLIVDDWGIHLQLGEQLTNPVDLNPYKKILILLK